MHWFERKIRRYEHRRWTTDDNRRVQPFHWGLEHIGGFPDDPDPAAFVREYARKAIDSSREWYAAPPATDYRLDTQNVLTFTSSIQSPWPENNTVHAQLFPARETLSTRSRGKRYGAGPAVLLLANWNAKWHGQNGLCRWIQRLGITVLKMSMPYHDRPWPMATSAPTRSAAPTSASPSKPTARPSRTPTAASTGSSNRAIPSSAFSVPASALPSATSPSSTTNASAPAASSTSPPTTPTS